MKKISIVLPLVGISASTSRIIEVILEGYAYLFAHPTDELKRQGDVDLEHHLDYTSNSEH